MLILSRFRKNRHHAPSQTQPRLAPPPISVDTFTAQDWIDLQLLAGKTITLQSLANENRLATGLWQWRLFIDTEADRRIMARLESRHLIAATNADHTCARLTPQGVTQIFHLCRHVRLAERIPQEAHATRDHAPRHERAGVAGG